MKVQRIYPEQKTTSFWKRNRQELLRAAFLLLIYLCLFLNLLLGGIPWSLIVIGGLCVLWVAFLYRPLVEHTLIKKLSDVSIVVCLYLFLLSALLKGNWGWLVGTIVFFADIIAIGLFYLLFFKKQKRNFMPLFELIFVGLGLVLVYWLQSGTLGWEEIVLAAVSLGIMGLIWSFFPREVALEVKKKLHV